VVKKSEMRSRLHKIDEGDNCLGESKKKKAAEGASQQLEKNS
jgi:hypothetical protein